MNSVSSIALSGMRTAQVSLDASAHNIANAQTPGFRRQLVAPQTQPGGGVTAVQITSPEAGEALVNDIVQQKVASYGFQANLLTLRTEQRMQGTLLDLFA